MQVDQFQVHIIDGTLDVAISNSEVFLVIKKEKKEDKSSGPDGILAEFYKVVSDFLYYI